MTTYGDNINNPYYHLVNPGYRYTYALIDFETGEVRTMASDRQFAPIKTLYGYFDGLRRQCKEKGDVCHLLLVNCRTGEQIEEVWDIGGFIELLDEIGDPVALIGAQ